MKLFIAEHDPSGTLRCFQERGPEDGFRVVPVVDSLPPSLHAGPWFSGAVSCIDCYTLRGERTTWVAIVPIGSASRLGRDLECYRCGSRNSGPVCGAWCSACGLDHMVVQEEGCLAEGGECPSCHAKAVFVEAA